MLMVMGEGKTMGTYSLLVDFLLFKKKKRFKAIHKVFTTVISW